MVVKLIQTLLESTLQIYSRSGTKHTLYVVDYSQLSHDDYFIFAAWKWNTHWIQQYWKTALQSGNISSLPL